MDFLNDLQKQAEAAKQKQAEQQKTPVAMAGPELYKAMNAKLNDAFEFWSKVFESLNTIKPDIRRTYFLDSDVKMDVTQNKYEVKGGKAGNLEVVPQPIVLSIRSIGAAPIETVAKSDSLIRRLKETLTVYNIGNEFKPLTNKQGVVEGGVFRINPAITSQITITPKPTENRIDITVRHLDRLGDYLYEYDVEEITNTLFEELAKVVLLRDNQFRMMGRRQLEKSSRFILSKNTAPGNPAAPAPTQSQDLKTTSGITNSIKNILSKPKS